MFDHNTLSELSTPCYIFKSEIFTEGVTSLKKALDIYFSVNDIALSVKTNSNPFLLRHALSCGCMAEVVSEHEYDLALRCGFSPERIIYNGPSKTKDSFQTALLQGSIVNMETSEEVDWITELASAHRNKLFGIGLRININLKDIGDKTTNGEHVSSRFGYFDSTGELQHVIKQLTMYDNIHINGIHMHRTTVKRLPSTYQAMSLYAGDIILKYSLKPTYIDFGGGYSAMLPSSPEWTEYTSSIYKGLSEKGISNIRIIMEPGSALTASTFDFVSKCTDVRVASADMHFCTMDCSRINIDPFFRKHEYFHSILYRDTDAEICREQHIAGFTCLENDIFFKLMDLPALRPGDIILFRRMGAYTMTLTPSFIKPAVCNIYELKNKKLIQIKQSDESSIHTK